MSSYTDVSEMTEEEYALRLFESSTEGLTDDLYYGLDMKVSGLIVAAAEAGNKEEEATLREIRKFMDDAYKVVQHTRGEWPPKDLDGE